MAKAPRSAELEAGVYLQELFKVSMEETEYQRIRLMQQTGCQAVTLPTARERQLDFRA